MAVPVFRKPSQRKDLTRRSRFSSCVLSELSLMERVEDVLRLVRHQDQWHEESSTRGLTAKLSTDSEIGPADCGRPMTAETSRGDRHIEVTED